jgi:hypothetical protein
MARLACSLCCHIETVEKVDSSKAETTDEELVKPLARRNVGVQAVEIGTSFD